MKIIDLGWCVARLDKEKSRLTIISPAEETGDFFIPPASVIVYGADFIKAFRDALIEEYPIELDQ